MTAGPSISFDSLREIRDRALLLSLGRAYLCEAVFMKKYGAELERAVGVLDRDVQKLKRRFPGKFAQEVDTDGALDGIRDLAARLQAPDRVIQEQCTVGKLGEDLEDRLKLLSDAVKNVQRQVEGGPAEYSGKEAVSEAFTRAGEAVRGGIGVLGKALGVALVALVIVFGYLFITMERQGGLEEEISRHRQEIQALRKDLHRLEEDKIDPLEFRIQQQEGEGYSRRDKVRLMELSVKLEALEQEAQELEGRIEQHRRGLQAAEKTLEALRRKGFFERLFRR